MRYNYYMQTDYIHLLEPTPKIHSKKCRFYSLVLRLFFQLTTYIVALITWYLYDYFIAGATFLLVYIVMGIVRSKIRNSVIPINQQEYQYNDQGIADWYIAKEICFEEELEK